MADGLQWKGETGQTDCDESGLVTGPEMGLSSGCFVGSELIEGEKLNPLSINVLTLKAKQLTENTNTFSAGNAYIRLLKWHTARPASHTLTDATSRLQYPGSLSHMHPTSVIFSPTAAYTSIRQRLLDTPSCPFS